MFPAERQLLLRALIALVAWIDVGTANAQTKTITISVEGPRPMAQAVEKLEQLSGIPLNYEDMPIYAASDLIDSTDTLARSPMPPSRRILVARGGSLSVPIVVDAATDKLSKSEDVRSALSAIIDAYNSSGLPGGFDYEFYNGVFFVKPVTFRDVNGATQPMKSILSTPITFPEEKRNPQLTLQVIATQLTKASGVHVAPAGFGSGGIGREVTLGAQNEPAYRVLARYFAGISGQIATADVANLDFGFSYQLLCDRNVPVSYFLNTGRVDSSPRWKLPPNKPSEPPPRLPGTPPNWILIPTTP